MKDGSFAPTKMLGELLENRIQEYLLYSEKIKGHSPATLKGKRNCLKSVVKWLEGKEFSLLTIRNFVYSLQNRGVKASSIAQICKTLHGFSHWLVWEEITEKDILEKLEPPKVEKHLLDVVEPELAEKVIFAGSEPGPGDVSRNVRLKEEHRQALRFGLRTALRSNELCHIYTKDLDIENGEFFVKTKGGRLEKKTLPADMLEEIRRRLAEFGRKRLFEVTPKTLNEVMKRGCQKLGVEKKLTCHSLRRIFGTSMAMADCPIASVSRLMGHSKLETTNAYYINAEQKKLGEKLHMYHPLLNATIDFVRKVEMIETHPLVKMLKDDSSVSFLVTKLEDGGVSFVLRPRN